MAEPLPAAVSLPFPQILPLRQRSDVIRRVVKQRLETVLPTAMRENGFDMWLILCQEDDWDPIHDTFCPMDPWRPILQMLVFFDGGPEKGIEGINISMTNMQGLFDSPWQGKDHSEQWALLRKIVEERDPKRIGINIGNVQWAAGGLTHNLYRQLVETLPEKYVRRLESAEPMAVHWASTLTADEIELYQHVADVAKGIIAECYSRKAITPGVTTIEDLVWYYWQRVKDLGLDLSFRPFFFRCRSDADEARFGPDDLAIRQGDFVRCDVGIKYLRLCSDHQQWAYLLRPGETDAPDFAYQLLGEARRLQDIFMDEFRAGLTGNELLTNILGRARREGVPEPKVYSHSLGLFLHQPGPLIGLPWEQERCAGRGDVKLRENNAFTMELSVGKIVPEWSEKEFRLGLEEDVVFTDGRCRLIHGRQTRFHLI
ncbi:MAG: aminopeptidase P family protein [Pirellulales bacterium]|nr:aminopeptidase P family protein [Pirellulales bacterium]